MWVHTGAIQNSRGWIPSCCCRESRPVIAFGPTVRATATKCRLWYFCNLFWASSPIPVFLCGLCSQPRDTSMHLLVLGCRFQLAWNVCHSKKGVNPGPCCHSVWRMVFADPCLRCWDVGIKMSLCTFADFKIWWVKYNAASIHQIRKCPALSVWLYKVCLSERGFCGGNQCFLVNSQWIHPPTFSILFILHLRSWYGYTLDQITSSPQGWDTETSSSVWSPTML